MTSLDAHMFSLMHCIDYILVAIRTTPKPDSGTRERERESEHVYTEYAHRTECEKILCENIHPTIYVQCGLQTIPRIAYTIAHYTILIQYIKVWLKLEHKMNARISRCPNRSQVYTYSNYNVCMYINTVYIYIVYCMNMQPRKTQPRTSHTRDTDQTYTYTHQQHARWAIFYIWYNISLCIFRQEDSISFVAFQLQSFVEDLIVIKRCS